MSWRLQSYGDVRLADLPQDRPWSRIGWSLVCKKRGRRFCEHRPNWHDRAGHAVHSPSTGKGETQRLKLTADRPSADPDKAARRLLERAHAFDRLEMSPSPPRARMPGCSFRTLPNAVAAVLRALPLALVISSAMLFAPSLRCYGLKVNVRLRIA